MNLKILKRVLQLCSSKTLIQFIDDLKTETVRFKFSKYIFIFWYIIFCVLDETH